MSCPLLYSTNVYLKYHIHKLYRNDTHYVWCSEHFDSKKLSAYSSGSLVAPSANPADIYRELKRDVEGRDSHSAKINAQKASLTQLAIAWEKNGEITTAEKDDIVYMIGTADFQLWRPLVYVIPREPVESRLQIVPMKKRAGYGNECIISDLKGHEFDLVEF